MLLIFKFMFVKLHSCDVSLLGFLIQSNKIEVKLGISSCWGVCLFLFKKVTQLCKMPLHPRH